MTEEQIQRGAKAIANAGSRDFSHHAGATIELIADQAKAGELMAMSTTFIAHCAIHRGDRRALLRSMPPAILESYLCAYRGLAMGAISRWRERNRDWADRLVRVVDDPARFKMAVDAMTAQIEQTQR